MENDACARLEAFKDLKVKHPRLDYYRQVLDQLRGHVAVKDRVMNLPLARYPEKKSRAPAEWLDMREAVVYALELLRVKVVFVD